MTGPIRRQSDLVRFLAWLKTTYDLALYFDDGYEAVASGRTHEELVAEYLRAERKAQQNYE